MTIRCRQLIAMVVLLSASVSSAQLPNVPVFSMWATKVSTELFGPNKCASCPAQNVPLGEIAPGDYIRVEIFVRDWDAEHNRGFCEGNIIIDPTNLCTNVGGSCISSFCASTFVGCATDVDCPDSHCVYSNCNPFPVITAYLILLDLNSLHSGSAGALQLAQIPCTYEPCEYEGEGSCPCAHYCLDPADVDCRHSYLTRCQTPGYCRAESSLFIETPRPDFVFHGMPHHASSSISPLHWSVLGYLNDQQHDGAVDDDQPRYLATALFRANADVSGTFSVQLDAENSVIADENWRNHLAVFQPLTLNFPYIIPQCTAIASATPAHRTIDARQPHLINYALGLTGLTSWEVTLSDPCDASQLVSDDFQTSIIPMDVPLPVVTQVDSFPRPIVLTLDRPAPPLHWLCLTRSGDIPNCVGVLPGDVNADLVANTADVMASLAELSSPTGMSRFSLDSNHSWMHTVEDVVRLLDLLNGADAYTPWLNAQLPDLPINP